MGADILGGYVGRLKSSALRMLALKAGMTNRVVGERLNEVLMDEEIMTIAKENALTTLASKLEARLALVKMKHMKILALRNKALQAMSEPGAQSDNISLAK